MNQNKEKANAAQANNIIGNLKKRGISGEYCESREKALAAAMTFLKDGSKVAWGGSITLDEIGLRDAVRKAYAEGRIEMIDGYSQDTLEKQRSEKVRALTSDVFFMSTNAITLEGELVNIDGNGNRVAALCYGPKQVVIVAGMNKVVSDVASAVKRIKTHACPANTIRLGRDTPCAETGKCFNCLKLGVTVCSMTVVTRFCNLGRIHVILVNDNLGY